MSRMVRKILLVGVLGLMISGCAASDADKKALQQGFADYNARHFDLAETAATGFIQKNANVPNVDEAYYLRGLARLGRGDKAGAIADLQVALQKTQRNDLKAKSLRTLGDIAYDEQTWTEARDDYQKALTFSPDAKEESYLEYRMGATLQSLGQWDAARPYFQRVIVLNADSSLNERALARMNARSFSIQFGAFADVRKAGELKARLIATGLSATVATESHAGQIQFFVRYGNYLTQDIADAARKYLLTKYPAAVVVP